MALADKLKTYEEKAPEVPAEDDRLIRGLLIPVKFQHGNKSVKGYLELTAEAVYLGKISAALNVALREAKDAGSDIELNVWDGSSSSSNWKKDDWRK